MPARAARTISQFLGDFEWHEEFKHVYTDGSCHNQQCPWLRRSGAGVFWGPYHPLNEKTNQSGQAHTSPRAELLAIVIAIEQARWPIHIFSDNQGFVIAVNKLLAGDHTPSLKNNVDLWSRISKRLHSKQKDILIALIKGHAVDKDIQEGKSSLAHQKGNNAADELANVGSKMIALPYLFPKGHILKRHIVLAIQAVFLACYNRRQQKW